MPGRGNSGAFGEICSTSNCTDYQSRRLKVKVKMRGGDGEKPSTQYAHFLNGTAVAVPRVILAIIENYQGPDGTVDVPLALREFMPDALKDRIG